MIPTAKNIKVLVIDNDHDILDIMTEALTYEGYEVKGLPGVDDILPEIRKYQPDIIILDYILNGINGGELCHQLKINLNTSQLPIVMMSAYPKVLQSLGDYGCNIFIPKPFDLDYLVNCIKTLTKAKAQA